MVRLTAMTMAMRNKMYGRETYPPQVPCNYKDRTYWVKHSDDAIRWHNFKWEQVKELADEFVKLYGTVEAPEKVDRAVDLELRLRWMRFLNSKFDPERMNQRKLDPGYIGPGRGVQMVVTGIKEYEYAKKLQKRREEKRAREAKSQASS